MRKTEAEGNHEIKEQRRIEIKESEKFTQRKVFPFARSLSLILTFFFLFAK